MTIFHISASERLLQPQYGRDVGKTGGREVIRIMVSTKEVIEVGDKVVHGRLISQVDFVGFGD